jgi:hypothetical protein
MIYQHYFIYYIAIAMMFFGAMRSPLWANTATAPTDVMVAGVLKLPDNQRITQVFDATRIIIFNTTNGVPTASFTQSVSVVNNYFRTNVNLNNVLMPFFEANDGIHVKIVFTDDIHITLPVASIPMAIKTRLAKDAQQMMDDQVVFYDHNNKTMGIGTQTPTATLTVNGAVRWSGTLSGDGAGLTNFSATRGADNYSYLTSQGGASVVATVNAQGVLIVGDRGSSPPSANTLVYGSLLLAADNKKDDADVSGAGSRWMWDSDRATLRMGHVPSDYWDIESSGQSSMAFGYATMAKGRGSLIGGGYYNEAHGDGAIVAGGAQNKAVGNESIIVSGIENEAHSSASIVLGGAKNIARQSGIVLGGKDNRATGSESVVAGQQNTVSGNASRVMGGQQNKIEADQAIALGHQVHVLPTHNRAVVIGLAETETTSIAPHHIRINAPHGMGIGTADTRPNQLTVNGAARAHQWSGDGQYITNIKSDNSAWRAELSDRPELLIHTGRLGIGTNLLMDSLTVSGSLHLSGAAVPDNGTIRYYSDQFSVYKNGEWVGLQMVDTNTTYNATQGLSLNSDHTFDLSLDNAQVGHTLIWSGTQWQPGFLGVFHESPPSDDVTDLSRSKGLYLPTGNVIVNTDAAPTESPRAPFTVQTPTSGATAAYFFDGTDHMSVSVNPPGLHFQGYYETPTDFKSSQERSGGVEVMNNDYFRIYIENNEGARVTAVALTTKNVRIMDNDLSEAREHSVFVGGTLGSRSFLLVGDDTASGVYLKDDYYRTCSSYDYSSGICYGDQARSRSRVVDQTSDGHVRLQSGPLSGNIDFYQGDTRVGRVALNNNHGTSFGLTSAPSLGAELDISGGSMHVSNEYGIEFYTESNASFIQQSMIQMNTSGASRIHWRSGNDAPYVSVSVTGNVAMNATANAHHDLYITHPTDPVSVGLNTTGIGEAGIQWSVGGSSYQSYSTGDQWVMSQDDTPYITLTTDGHVGWHDPNPSHALSLGAPTVLLGASDTSPLGVYFYNPGDTNLDPAIQVTNNQTVVSSSGDISFWRPNQSVVVDIQDHGVGIGAPKSVRSIGSDDIGLQVHGRFRVQDGTIITEEDHPIFPLTVETKDQTISVTSVDTLEIDTNSGLTLTNSPIDGTDVPVVTAKPYYNQVYFSDASSWTATGNTSLNMVGDGVSFVFNNQSQRAVSNDSAMDKWALINDVLSGGVISGNVIITGNLTVTGKIIGSARGLRNIPSHWTATDRAVYYEDGDVGIGTDDPRSMLDVPGTTNVVAALIETTLAVPFVESTSNFTLRHSNKLWVNSTDGDIIMGRHDSVTGNDVDLGLKITPSSQLLFGVESSQYTVAMGANNTGNTTEFRLDRDSGDSGNGVYFERENSDAFLRVTDTTVSANKGLGLYASGQLGMRLFPDGFVGILEPSPKNALDVHGALAVGTTDVAPENGLIVMGRVGIGLTILPKSALEVSGSVLVGERQTDAFSSGVHIRGDGDYQLLIGGPAKGTENVAVNGDLGIRDGQLHIRKTLGNESEVLTIGQKNTITDVIEQAGENIGLTLTSVKGFQVITADEDESTPALVVSSTGNMGVGGMPQTPLHIQGDSAVVRIKSATQAKLHLSRGAAKGVIGASASDGLAVNAGQNTLNNAELIIRNRKVGVHKNPIDNQGTMQIDGNINATDYDIKDDTSEGTTGYRRFQSVPVGVIILWLSNDIPSGWEECNGANGCPDMDGKYVKGVNGNYTNIRVAGGENNATLSSTTHTHNSVGHDHTLTTGGHTHDVIVTDKPINGTTGDSHGYVHKASTNGTSYGGVLTEPGNHTHGFNNTHGHSGATFTDGGHDHGDSEEDTHDHEGDAHDHTIDNRPTATQVRFIIKVAES